MPVPFLLLSSAVIFSKNTKIIAKDADFTKPSRLCSRHFRIERANFGERALLRPFCNWMVPSFEGHGSCCQYYGQVKVTNDHQVNIFQRFWRWSSFRPLRPRASRRDSLWNGYQGKKNRFDKNDRFSGFANSDYISKLERNWKNRRPERTRHSGCVEKGARIKTLLCILHYDFYWFYIFQNESFWSVVFRL